MQGMGKDANVVKSDRCYCIWDVRVGSEEKLLSIDFYFVSQRY